MDKGVNPFPKCINPKVNAVVRLGFELASYDVEVQHVSPYFTGTHSLGENEFSVTYQTFCQLLWNNTVHLTATDIMKPFWLDDGVCDKKQDRRVSDTSSPLHFVAWIFMYKSSNNDYAWNTILSFGLRLKCNYFLSFNRLFVFGQDLNEK